MSITTRVFLAAPLLFATTLLAQQSQQPSPSPTTPPAQSAPAQSAPAVPDAPSPAPAAPALPDSPDATASPAIVPSGPTVVFDSSMGRMVCKLFSKEAPNTVANFIGLATGTKDWTNPATHEKEHGVPLYNGTTFHRVIPGFMIQGGDPIGDGTGDPGYMFNDEIVPGLTFDVPGLLAMANSGPNTNGSQFFITEAPQPSLDGNYSIFGQCDDSAVSVVKAIARVDRDPSDKPLTPVTLNKVTIVPQGQPLPPAPAQPAAAPAATPAAPAGPGI
jgi:peptidyl-prolyl cis-trans isomerase A (cyclophilin A)